jgi:hypothetical protein
MRIGVRISRETLLKARRDLSKLTPKVITDKNGHKQTVYVRLGLSAEKDAKTDKDSVLKKEPWDSSTDKAKTLKIKDFGMPDEVREMASPVRAASNRHEATKILKYLASQGPLTNKTGLTVTLSSDSRGKIVSSKALKTSYGQKAHFLAVANIDKLFSHAIEPWKFELNPGKNNDDLMARRYLYAPLAFDNKIIPVKITIKEYKDTNLGKRLYSVEAIDAILG